MLLARFAVRDPREIASAMTPKAERGSAVKNASKGSAVATRPRLTEQGWFSTAVITGVMVVGLVTYLVTDSVLVAFGASSPIGLICFFIVALLVDRRRAHDAAQESRSAEG